MKRRNRVFSLIVAVVLLLCSFPYSSVRAASGTLNISTNKTDVNIGDKVTIVISLSADAVIYSGEFNFNYNSSIFSYEGYAGKINIKYDPISPEASKSFSWTYIFTALTTGTGEFNIDGCRMIMESGNNMEIMPISIGKASVRVWAPGSDDASLKSLEIPGRTLSPAFKPGTTSYTVYLPNEATSVSINAVLSQSGSSDARSEMSTIPNPLPVGNSKVTIKTYAPNGSSMTYTVTFIRADAAAIPTPTPEPLKAMEVSVDGKTYSLARDFTGVALPQGFEVNPYTYHGEEISIGKGLVRNLILMYLKSEDGSGSFYIYDETADYFTKYIEIKTTSVIYTVLSAGKDVKIPAGYEYKTTAELFGQSITVWKQSDKATESAFVFYGMNWNGEANWYQYDSKECTVQRYITSPGSVSQGAGAEKLQSAQTEIDKLKKDADKVKISHDRDSSIKLTLIIGLAMLCLFLGFIIVFKLRHKQSMGIAGLREAEKQIDNLFK